MSYSSSPDLAKFDLVTIQQVDGKVTQCIIAGIEADGPTTTYCLITDDDLDGTDRATSRPVGL